jgi:broad specificity phosphatase PhoE
MKPKSVNAWLAGVKPYKKPWLKQIHPNQPKGNKPIMAIIFLIRHGETDYVGKRLAGRIPGIPLNEKGRAQAQQLAAKIGRLPFQRIFSSPIQRTIETAAPLAALHGLQVETLPGLIEIDYGDWEGLTPEQFRSTALWSLLRTTPSQVRFNGGESYIEVQERVVTAVESVAARLDRNELAACFSHADVIALAAAHYLNMPLDAFLRLNIATASITVLLLGDSQPKVPHINLTELPETFNF